MKYKTTIVLAYFKERGLPPPEIEYAFAADAGRKWRFDFGWPYHEHRVALEVEGNAWGTRGGGRHMRQSDMNKYNFAALLGWTVFRVTPQNLCRQETIDMLKQALERK